MTRPAALDTDGLHALVPLAATLGIVVGEASREAVRLTLDWRPELCTAGGVLHGGALMALADTAGAVATWLALPEDAAGTTTVESKTNLLAAVRAGTVVASSSILHGGRTLVVVETELRRADGRLAAKTTQTQAVFR
jgi:uncharacterized protein (TIGR00369 family)